MAQKIVVDSIHGDIKPSDLEWRIIDTPPFQRLRQLKQLQMGYLVYPNATHTRFAHSLGVLKVMQRILEQVTCGINDKEDLRLAALLHDIGHYPYSHLLEGVEKVILTEEQLSNSPKNVFTTNSPYPDHEEVGRAILSGQPDLLKVLGGAERAERIGHIFSRTHIADQQLSKLIHSSFDMDRLDYLIRDSQATGVPYGLVDIDYLLNHVKQSATGTIGITHKAIAAAEHLLLARSFVFRCVCQHKTVYGIEEAARQLLRRLRDRVQQGGQGYGVPQDGAEIMEIAKSQRLHTFTDAFLDKIFAGAASSEEEDFVIRTLARSIISRRPPRLLWEKRTFSEDENDHNEGKVFLQQCQLELRGLADKFGIDERLFLICELKRIGFESRGHRMMKDEAQKVIAAGERNEMIRVFETPESEEPIDIVDIKHSILNRIGSYVFRTYRLYYVCPDDDQDALIANLKEVIKAWA